MARVAVLSFSRARGVPRSRFDSPSPGEARSHDPDLRPGPRDPRRPEDRQPPGPGEDIEELLAIALAVEADPEDLALVGWLESTVEDLLRQPNTVAGALEGLEALLRLADKDLKNDWFRMTTGRAELDRREAERVTVRRALGLMRDPAVQATFIEIAKQATVIAPKARYVACPALGIEVYALTHKGTAVGRALRPRLGRFTGVPLRTFLASFDKVDAKMRAFAAVVHALDGNIGFVKKNRHQVVIGLAKTGLPAQQALGTYHDAMKRVGTPDGAVTCARNATMFGGTEPSAIRLQQAEHALRNAGLPICPMLLGAAKCLLAFDPVDRGVPRFLAMKRSLDRVFGPNEINYKHAARLIASAGQTEEVMNRVEITMHALAIHPDPHGNGAHLPSLAVAIAAMVKNGSMVDAAVVRFRELEARLVKADLAAIEESPNLALECIGCPGSPEEVVATVRALTMHVAAGATTPAHIAIAVAFAKRFAI